MEENQDRIVENEDKIIENKSKNKKSMIFNITFIIVIFILLIIYMISVDGIDNIMKLLKVSDVKWVAAGFACIVIYWICESICLHIPLKKMYKNQKFGETFRISMIGQLFNNLTPFSSGGQPIQAYEMTKSGKKMSDTMSILVMKFIVSQTTLVAFTAIVLCFQFDSFTKLVDNFFVLAVVGFAVNIFAILFILMIGINKKFVFNILKPIYLLLGKIKVFKNVDEKLEKLTNGIDNFSEKFLLFKNQKMVIFKMVLISLVQFMAYYYITYAVYRAFGNTGVSVFSIIPAQAFLMMIMAFTPLPGAGLGAEGGFLLLFNSMFEKGTLNMSILFWRVYTFYIPIIVGALFLIPSKKEKESKKENQKESQKLN